MSELTLRRWIRSARSGEQLMYHRGLLMQDRQDASAPHNYNGIGVVLWQAYQRGQVTLAQRRVSEGCYEYLAIKT